MAALLAIALLRVFLHSPFQPLLPFPLSLLTVAVVYSVFRAGRASGIVSTIFSLAYFAYFLEATKGFENNSADAWNRLISWSIALPILVLFVGKLKDQALRAATQREQDRSLKEITEAMPQIMFTSTPEGKLETYNRQWQAYTGPVVSENTIMACHHPDDFASASRVWEQCIHSGEDFLSEQRLLRASDKTYRWHLVRACAVRDGKGKITRWVGTLTDIQERKESEARITSYHLRTEMIMENVPAIIWAVNLHGVFTFSEGYGLRLLGLKPGERVGKNYFDIFPDGTPEGDLLRAALNGKIATGYIHKLGVSFECKVSPYFSANGKEVIGAVGIATDATSRLESENAKAQLSAANRYAKLLEESEAKFKGAFENSPIGIALAHFDGSWIDVNPAFCAMLGYSRAELVEKKICSLAPEADQLIGSDIRSQMASGAASTCSFEKKYFHKDGHEVSFWISGSVIRDSNEKPQYILGQMIDITDRRKSERELRETTRLLQTLVDSSPVAILALDKNRNITVWNPACETLFGWAAQEALGNFLPFVPAELKQESLGFIERIEQNKVPFQFEADRQRKDGSYLRISTSAIPLLDEQGQVQGLMAVLVDYTERSNAREELLANNRALKAATEAKSDFLANMSHEIRTPLNGVIGMTGLLLDTQLQPEQQEYAETIRSSAEILLTLINDILDFSKIEAGKLHLENINFNLEQVIHNIEKILTPAAKKKNIRLLRSVNAELPALDFRGDPTRIGQVLANLISNAIKFTAHGQVIVELQHDKELSLWDPLRRTHVRVEITDTGIGLSSEAVARLFQPFTQADASTNRRYGGTGLGLSISKRLVESMGGEIGVRSLEGSGSTFWFTLVLEPAAAEMPVLRKLPLPKDSAALPGNKPVRILLAEDNSVNQIIAVKLLEKFGFRVDAVANGLEAVAAVQSMPYDLVLMDCQMPELDGYGASEQIRALPHPRQKSIPIIAMTANAMSSDREKCMEAGMNEYVTKPVNQQELLAVISRVLTQKTEAA